jgi:hypothetical protein
MKLDSGQVVPGNRTIPFVLNKAILFSGQVVLKNSGGQKMEEPTYVPPAEEQAAFELGEMLGRRQAFGAMAGRCSAADAECLRRMRDQKLFLSRSATWNEFCRKYLGLSGRNANRIIRLLEEFGPCYFELSQLARISPEQFRAIAPTVREQRIHAQGEVIALIPENSEKIAAAVADLRRQARPRTPAAREPLSAVEQRCSRIVAELRKILGAEPEGTQKLLMRSTIREAITSLKGLDIGLEA